MGAKTNEELARLSTTERDLPLILELDLFQCRAKIKMFNYSEQRMMISGYSIDTFL